MLILVSILGENILFGFYVFVLFFYIIFISFLLFLNLVVGIFLIFYILFCGWEEVFWLFVVGGVGWFCGKLGVELGMLGRGWWVGVGFGVCCGLLGVVGLGGLGVLLFFVDCVFFCFLLDGGSCRWVLYVFGG